MLTVLIVSTLLFGLATLCLMFGYFFLRCVRSNRVLKLVVAFGALGLLIPSTVTAVNYIANRTLIESVLLWPSSTMLMALDPPRGPALNVVLVFGMSFLSNVGLYGFVGLCAGGIWVRVQSSNSMNRENNAKQGTSINRNGQ